MSPCFLMKAKGGLAYAASGKVLGSPLRRPADEAGRKTNFYFSFTDT